MKNFTADPRKSTESSGTKERNKAMVREETVTAQEETATAKEEINTREGILAKKKTARKEAGNTRSEIETETS